MHILRLENDDDRYRFFSHYSCVLQLFSDYFFFTGVENASLNYGGEVSVYRYTYIQSVTFNSLRGDGSLRGKSCELAHTFI